jgi:flagellar hook-associated protein 3 FlgL
MKATFISTKSITEATRLSMSKMQSRLVEAQQEVVTSRLADVGKSLGFRTGQVVSLRQEHLRLSSMIDVNASVTTRLDMSQEILKNLMDSAQAFIGQLIGSRSTDTGPALVQNYAKSGLVATIDMLNSSSNGAFLFSGINADVKPVADYFQDPPGANQQAVADEFALAFGMAQSDPGLDVVTAADMQTFFDGPFADMFDTAQWTANWSAASSQDIRSRISTYELMETSTNANEVAMRKLVSAFTMVADLGVENLNRPAFQTVVDAAIKTAGEAVQELSKLKANLGIAQERVAKANDKMSIQIDIISTHIGTLEGIDPHDAAMRISTIMTQIDTAYALTARIQKLSLLNYL